MPVPNDRPLPPTPRDDQEYADFIREHSAEEIADLVIGLHLCRIESEESLDLLEILKNDICPDNPEYGMAVVEVLTAHDDPSVRKLVMWMYEGLLGRGIRRIEEIVWDELLSNPDKDTFTFAYELLLDLVDGGHSEALVGRSYDEVYGRQEHLQHLLKLSRARPRHDALIGKHNPSPATPE